MARKRCIHALDEIRGFCVFCMIFDHCLFTLGYVFGHSFCAEFFDILAYISPAFAATFVIICGISSQLSSSNLKRGTKILAAAAVISLGSLIVMPDMPIIFGVLHLLGVCVLLFIPLRKAIDKIPTALGIAVCIILFLLTYGVDSGRLGIGALSIELPDALYSGGFFMALGFRSPASAYADYFPLLPWCFAFFAGAFIGKSARKGQFPEAMYKSRVPFFSLFGKNAFFVYLIHQPLIYGVYYIISLFGGI
ncbi:MAG: heparan-alpha-glucosaminide N-acetyltransferase domain-containing protein [Ruminococcus sp.]